MTIDELLKRILFLVPNGKFAIWEDNGPYLGEPNPVSLSGFLVDWNRANGVPPPTQQQVDGVNLNAANQQAENRRKIARNLRLRDDLSIRAAFRAEKKTNPDITFSDFIDQVEADSAT